jgi:glycosyltransferase involved in cell wall biosynthesis
LRFLHLTTFYPPYSFGGDAVFLHRLCHALADEGHEVDVVHCTDAYHLLHPEPPEVAFPDHPGVRVHRLASGVGALSPLVTQQTGRAAWKAGPIRRLLDGGRFDVVHYHNVSLLGPEVLTFEAGEAVKLYTTHEHWLVCPTHVLWKYGRRPCERPACTRCTLLAGRPPQLWRHTGLLERASRHVDRFVAPSRFTARMHAERGFPRPVGHLPYFIEPADDDWRHPGTPPHPRPYALFVGRLEPIKGLHTVLEAWRRSPGLELDLLVAGTGSQEAELVAQAAGDVRVRFLGAVAPAALGPLYAHAVATLVPSLTYETFGLTVIESLARKTPVIARDRGALSEVVEESGGGFLYQTDDEMLASVRRLADDAGLRHELGERGYRVFLERWTRRPHLERYDGLLAEVARERAARRRPRTGVPGIPAPSRTMGPEPDPAGRPAVAPAVPDRRTEP